MSYLATALQAALRDTGMSQTALAEAATVPGAQVNRAARGTVMVGIRTTEAIARVLPEPHNAHVIVGWLRDQLSLDTGKLVEIHPVTLTLTDPPPKRELPPLDDDLGALILWIAEMAIRHTAVRDSLRSLRAAASAVLADV